MSPQLWLVGIGTGNPDHITREAERAIRDADLVLLPHKEDNKAELAHVRMSLLWSLGVPDERMGEVGVACVIMKAGRQFDAKALHAWCRDNMANYKVPRHFLAFDAFPLNASGKVLKKDLKVQVLERLAV